jgi:hypothetical protein
MNCRRNEAMPSKAAPKIASPTNIQNVVAQNCSRTANILKISELSAKANAQMNTTPQSVP